MAPKKLLLVSVLLAPSCALAGPPPLSELLEKGPVVIVEETPDGRFAQSTALIEIHAPPERVWATVLAVEHYSQFMPKVTQSEVTRRPSDPTVFDVRLVYDLPGPDTDYTARMRVDADRREIVATWLKDDLRGSSWSWRVEPSGPGRTLLFHTVRVKNFSPLLQSVEDDQQTVTIGVNVSSALATVKALKRRAEGDPQARR